MNAYVYEKLQYTTLKSIIKDYCVSVSGKGLIDSLSPSPNKKVVQNRLEETSEARALIDYTGSIPIQGMQGIEEVIDRMEKDVILDAHQLMVVCEFLRGCRKIKSYMQDKSFYAPTLHSYSFSLQELRNIEEEVHACIRNGKVRDEASKELKKIRKQIAICESRIEERLDKFLKNSDYKPYIQEFFISKRQDRLTIPIKAAYKNKIEGTIVESTPKTVFIEPSVVSKYTSELTALQAEEAMEEYKVLTSLTGLVYTYLSAIKLNLEVMGQYDMIHAKAKYSNAINGRAPKLNDYGYIRIKQGRHPLLTGDVVPLDFEIGKDFRTLIITGPNAGGKTVVLKTVGLLTLAMQSGFHIPVDEDTNMSVFDHVYVDIGDDQSIEKALSTFSSHVKNLAQIIKLTKKSTLLLFDEIGSGTEPSEGAALAIAILEKLYHKGAITIATTHYNAIKDYSTMHPDFTNAAMAFNKETLEPLYKLIMNQSGESNALWISNKMGIDRDVLATAKGYLEGNAYNLSLVDQNKVRKAKEASPDTHLIQEHTFSKGDKVYLLDKEDYGVVYEGQDKENNVTVYYTGEYIKIYSKRLKLEFPAVELYPTDYDLDSLFTSYSSRKVEKDIARGSKKMLKKIKKHGIEEVTKNHRLKH